jgi:hypothetical protein
MQSVKYSDKYYDFEFYNVTYEINIISPLLELKRQQIMNNIKTECKYLLEPINVDVNNVIPRWIFLQYKDSKHFIDPIFPQDGTDFTQLKKDIYYLSGKKINGVDIDNLITKLDLTNKFNNAIRLMKEYIESEYYKKNMEFIKVDTIEENDFVIYSFKFLENFQNLEKIDFEYLKFKIHKNLINKSLKKYKSGINDEHFKIIIMCIILRYNTLESYNQQLAVNPKFYKYLGDQYNINFELFASSFNCYYDNYCSLFYDLEKELNSKGSFNIINIKKGFFVANPPFDEEVMKNMAIKFIESLKNVNAEELSVFITIPAWDNPNYSDYEVLTLLKQSGLIKFIKKIPKNRAICFEYYTNKFINPADLYFILIQNEKGHEKYNIATELEISINNYFPIPQFVPKKSFNKRRQRGGDSINDNSDYDDDLNMVLIKHMGKNKFNENIIYKKKPPKYISPNIKKYYDLIAKHNVNYLLNPIVLEKNKINLVSINLTNIMNNIFDDLYNVNNILLIDITYTCGNNKYILKRLGENYKALSDHFLKNNIFTTFKVTYLLNPKYNNKSDNDEINYIDFLNEYYKKYDFIFISGNLEYNMIKSISYYSEQMSYIIHFLQIYMLLSMQEKNGSFIFLIYTCDTKVYRNYITLLQNYYKEIYLFKIMNVKSNISYIIGKQFLGISDKELEKIKLIVSKIINNESDLGFNLNVFNEELRKKHNVIKHFNYHSNNNFIHNLFDFEDKKISKYVNGQINKFIVNY